VRLVHALLRALCVLLHALLQALLQALLRELCVLLQALLRVLQALQALVVKRPALTTGTSC
jgi:hypothetical protein